MVARAARHAPAIRCYGDRLLRRVCRPVEAGSDEARRVGDDLCRVLETGAGVGLAAPQIGHDLRICAVEDRRDAKAHFLVLVNPEIEALGGGLNDFEEGCLSFPGLYRVVRRPRSLRVIYSDLEGRRRTIEDDGMLARIVQHEVDHLDGVLFVDRLPAWRRILLWPRLWWLALKHGGYQR